MQSWLVGPLHLQAITEQKTSFSIHSGMHTHAPVLTHGALEEEHGKQAHQVPIHQADAVFYTWAYAPVEGPNCKNTRKEKLVIFQKNLEDQYQLCQTLIIVIRQLWNIMNLKLVRRWLLYGCPEMNCKYHINGMQRNKSM